MGTEWGYDLIVVITLSSVTRLLQCIVDRHG